MRFGLKDDWFGKFDAFKNNFQDELKDKVDMPLTYGLLGKDLNKYDIESIDNYKSKKEILEKEGILKYTTADELRIEQNNRIIEPELLLQRRFLDVNIINLRGSKTIKIINSIVNGDIHITSEGNSVDIYIDNTIILGKLVIRNVSAECHVNIAESVLSELLIYRNQIDELNIYSTRIFYGNISENRMIACRIENNYIRYLLFYDNTHEIIQLHYSQLHHDYLNIPKSKEDKRYKKAYKEFNVFKYMDDPQHVTNSYNIKELEKVKTLEFLSEHGQSRSNREFFSDIKEKMGYYSQQHNIGKIIMKTTKSLVSPLRVILMLIFYYAVFTVLYTQSSFQFKISGVLYNGLSISNSLYFSGITLLTIGYGDIVPIGHARILTILEGVGGILITGSFLLALVRKYLD